MSTGIALLSLGAVLAFAGLLLSPSQELDLTVGQIVQAVMAFSGVVIAAIGAATIEIVSQIRAQNKK